jgi:hypothetical protein
MINRCTFGFIFSRQKWQSSFSVPSTVDSNPNRDAIFNERENSGDSRTPIDSIGPNEIFAVNYTEPILSIYTLYHIVRTPQYVQDFGGTVVRASVFHL